MNKIEEDDRPARRTMNKQEAVRRLLHASVRMVMNMEDPFAIHLLVHSADKSLIDIAKKQNKLLRMDWEDYIKPDYHKAFFQRHRQTYNYLKHADDDFADELPVRNIAMMNVMQLFMACMNYRAIFDETDHMTLFAIFMFNIIPQVIIPDGIGKEMIKSVKATESMTPKAFFEVFESKSEMLPRFWIEASKDMQDVIDFYILSLNCAWEKPKALVSSAFLANTRPPLRRAMQWILEARSCR